jgi:hypothetical protein
MVLRGHHCGGYQRLIENYNALPTLQEIRDAHGWKRDYEKYLPLSRFIFRPLGFLLAWVAIRTGWTTESVAWLSGIVGVAGCLFLMLGGQNLLPYGIALLLFFNLLDCVDGSIARTMKTENPYGRFLDSVCGGMIDLAFWGVLGIVAFTNPNLLLWQNPLGYGTSFWLAVGSSTCFLSIHLAFLEKIFDRSLQEDWDRIQMAKKTARGSDKSKEDSDAQLSAGSLKGRYVLRMINNNLRVRETQYFVLVVAYLTSTLDFLLGFYLLYYLIENVFLLIVYSRRGRHIRRLYS